MKRGYKDNGGQIFIDALHVLGEDYSFAGVVSLVRSLLASIKSHKGKSRRNTFSYSLPHRHAK